MKPATKLIIGLLVGGAAVSLLIAAAGFRDALDVMGHMNGRFIVLAGVMTGLRIALYALQLTWLGRRSGKLSVGAALALALVVYGFGAVTPASPAEGLTLASHELRRRGRSKREARMTLGFSEWFTQRTFYAVTAIDLILVVSLGHLALSESWPFIVAASMVLLALIGTAVLAYRPQSAERLAVVLSAIRIRRPQPRAQARQAGAAWHADAMAVVGPPANRARLASVSALAVIADATALWSTCRAAGLSVPGELALLAATVGTMASWVPVLPNGLGVVEVAIPAVLHRFGARLDDALAATLVYRAITVLLPALAGALAVASLRAHHRRARHPGRSDTPRGILDGMDQPDRSSHMFFRQYYLGCLSHASYLIGDTTTGRAVVVDPQRDVAEYLADAEANGLTIVNVLETHFHADFLSGHLELAAHTGASIGYGSAAAGRAEFPIETFADGERISLGELELEIRETPGHTPESISIVIYPHGHDAAPYGVLTGDTLFIGDVGRPDLLASVGVTADELARQLYHSIHEKLLALPDATKVFPAHGAGSACGKNLSTETVSTIGEQRRTNYALSPMSEDDFVEAVTQGQSVAPLYFAFAANRNRELRDLLADDARVPELTMDEVLAHQHAGAVVLDGRDDMAFAAGHLRGSINIGLGGRFAEYAGEVMAPGTPIVLVTEPGHEPEAKVRLARIGFDKVLGALEDPINSFVAHPELVEPLSRLSADALAGRLAAVPGLVLIDVRNPGEVALGSIPGARNISLPALLGEIGNLDPTAPTVVHCAGGYRSAIAASLLRSRGFTDVSDLIGGYAAWEARTTGTPATVGAES